MKSSSLAAVLLGEGAQVGLAAGKPVALDASMYDTPEYEIAKARPANATEWWIEVKSGGRSGWFERGKYPIEGSDRCE
jgi:hypothetical protein